MIPPAAAPPNAPIPAPFSLVVKGLEQLREPATIKRAAIDTRTRFICLPPLFDDAPESWFTLPVPRVSFNKKEIAASLYFAEIPNAQSTVQPCRNGHLQVVLNRNPCVQ
jgi:hypothetical protein